MRFVPFTEMKTIVYPTHPLEKALHCATRAVIRMELQKAQPIEDYWKALEEQVKIDSLIGEAKQYYCQILTEVLGYENTEDKWKNEWTTFVQMSANTTNIDGIAYQNLYFPILQADLQVWLTQLLTGIQNQKEELKNIQRNGLSPAEGNKVMMEWLDIQQDFKDCVVLCVALRSMNCPKASLWDEAQRIGEIFWHGLIDFERDYYK